MSDPQALVSFPGLADVLSAKFTLSPGIEPSACMLRIVPQKSFRVEVGELQFRFGNVRFAFPDCALQSSSIHFEEGGAVLRLKLFDRRWKWRFGEIYGDYNQRDRDGKIVEATQKNARQLAAICLRELGEPDATITALPENVFPRTQWNGLPPAKALAKLCDAFHCRVVLSLDNRVHVHQIGVGRELPANGSEVNVGFGVESAQKPDSIKFVGGPTLFQRRLRLAAVGQDRDGSIKPIDELSYRPAHGWSMEYEGYLANLGDPDDAAESVLDRRDRELAMKSVFKWYAVATDRDGGLQAPGFGTVKPIDRIFPLHGFRLDHALDAAGVRRSLAPMVEGLFYPLGADRRNTASDTLYTDSFAIDHERGMVMFDHPVVRLGDDGETLPAELFLTTAFSVRERETSLPHHEAYEERLPGGSNNTGAMVVSSSDTRRTIVEHPTANGSRRTADNLPAFQREAKRRIASVRGRFASHRQSEVHYVGLCRIDLDGAIDQMTWSLGSQQAAETIASRNRMHSQTAAGDSRHA